MLVPIIGAPGAEPELVFTRRGAGMSRHAGEISFPGGLRGDGDASLLDTALRETTEEIGVAREAVDVLGALPPFNTRVTRITIAPFVGVLSVRPEWVLSPAEVEEVIELPLRRLAAVRSTLRLTWQGVEVETPLFELDGTRIWGATARILSSLLEAVAAAEEDG